MRWVTPPAGPLSSGCSAARCRSASSPATFRSAGPPSRSTCRILKRANLVVDRAVGNRRVYEVDPAGVDALRAYFERFWNHTLAAFKQAAEAEREKKGCDPMTSVAETTNSPVRKTINVNTSAERAFHVFTEGFDTWWPRSHSIGPSALQKAIIEGKSGGRCYQQSVDGSRMRLGPDPRVGAAATVRDRVAAECRVGVRARHGEGERGRGQLHPRTGRVDARRSRTPPFRSSRRRRAADPRGSGFAGRLGRPAADVRGGRGVARCSRRAGARSRSSSSSTPA